jgi:glycine/D-amino acid oxidase-like deaminating enzyme
MRFDPTTGSRELTGSGVDRARQFLGRRFPALRDAPLLGGEVCQYEATPDSHFILDSHPEASNVWLAGGGSGHGFKMGPVIGEIVASAVLGGTAPDPAFALGRFARVSTELTQEKWR